MVIRTSSCLLYAAAFFWHTSTGIHLVTFNGTVRLQTADFPTITTTNTNTGWMRGIMDDNPPPYAYGSRGEDACPVLGEHEYQTIHDAATCIAAAEFIGVEYDPDEEEDDPAAVCNGKACSQNGACYSVRLNTFHAEMSQWLCSLILTTTTSTTTGTITQTGTATSLTTRTVTATSTTTVTTISTTTSTTTTVTTLDEGVLHDEDGTTVLTKAFWAEKCQLIAPGTLYIKIVMGNVFEYYRPIEGRTFCEMLTSERYHQWNPRADDPNYNWITPYYLLNKARGPLGGSIGGWAPDGRSFLSFWASSDEPGAESQRPGGCCDLDYPDGVDPYAAGAIVEIDQYGNAINSKGDVIKARNSSADGDSRTIAGGPQNWGLPFTMYHHRPFTTTTTSSTDTYTTTATKTSLTEYSSSTTTFHTTTLTSTTTASTHTIKTTSTLTSTTPTTVTLTTSTRSRFTITTSTVTTSSLTSSTTSTTSSTFTTKTIITATSATSTTGTTTTLTSTTFTKTKKTRTTKTTTTRTTTTKTTSTETLFPKPTTTTTPTTVSTSTLTTPTTTTPSTTTTTSGPCVCGPHGTAVYALSHGQARTCTDFEYTGFSYHGAPASCEAMAKYCNHKDMAEDVRIACPVTCCARAYRQLLADEGNATAPVFRVLCVF